MIKEKFQDRPSFLITIDTEGDNLWSKPENITTKNASYLPRFQELCEKYKFKPTYLTNFEMAKSSVFQEFGKDILKRKVGEIGMHLHAWNMPSSYQLTRNDLRYQPCLIEYPEKIMREKISYMTQLLENTFGIKMLSHRAGKWVFDERYAGILIENGYKVDCSVTPYVTWRKNLSNPAKEGVVFYTEFPQSAYFIDPSNISIPGKSILLEIPVSIEKLYSPLIDTFRTTLRKVTPVRKALNRFFPLLTWLRPNGHNLINMLKLIKNAVQKEKDYVEFMLHSSEFMPGGSPTFTSEKSIEKLYKSLDILFNEASRYFTGCTLAEYYYNWIYKEKQSYSSTIYKNHPIDLVKP